MSRGQIYCVHGSRSCNLCGTDSCHMPSTDRMTRRTSKRPHRSNTFSWLRQIKRMAGCTICGESDLRCLEFDHVCPHTKHFCISSGAYHNYPLRQIWRELDKCQVLCSNCHKKKSSESTFEALLVN